LHEKALRRVAKHLLPDGVTEVSDTEMWAAARIIDAWLNSMSGIHLSDIALLGQSPATRMRAVFGRKTDKLFGFVVESWCLDCLGHGCRLCYLEKDDDRRISRGESRQVPHIVSHKTHGCKACRDSGWVARE
jgi:hypothetical protein